jgi:hypothetical protein
LVGGVAHRAGFIRESTQPLLDACREILPILGDQTTLCGLFWPGGSISEWVGTLTGGSAQGSEEAALTCSLGWGAAHTVVENRERSPHFARYQEFPKAVRASLFSLQEGRAGQDDIAADPAGDLARDVPQDNDSNNHEPGTRSSRATFDWSARQMRHAKASTFNAWAPKSTSIYPGIHRGSNSARVECKELAKFAMMFTS